MTKGELYKKYKKQSIIAKALKWVAIITPFAIVFGVKFNEYVEVLDEASKVKLSIGAVLAIIVSIIAIFKEFKKEKATKPIASVVGWGLAFAFAYLLEAIMLDMALILGAEFVGQVVALGFDYWDNYATEEAKEYKKLSREDGTLEKEEPKKDDVGAML